MTITQVNYSSNAETANTAAFSIPVPTGASSGHVAVIVIGFNGGPGVVTWPSGFTEYGPNSGVSNPKLYMAYKVLDGTEGSTFDISTSNSTKSGSACAVYSGVDNTTPMDATPVVSDGASTSTPSVTGITTATDNAMLVVGIAINSSSTTITENDSKITEIVEVAGKKTEADEGTFASHGATGNFDYTLGGSREWAGIVFALKPAGAGAAAPDPVDVLHDHTIDTSSISQTQQLSNTEVAHDHTIDKAPLSQTYNVSVTEVSHDHTIDTATVIKSSTISVTEIAHSHTIDGTSVSQVQVLSTIEISHSHTIDKASLTQDQFLSPVEISHTHKIDKATASGPGVVDVTVVEISHTNIVDVSVTTQTQALSVTEIIHNNVIEQAGLTQLNNLNVTELLHYNTVDIATISLPTPSGGRPNSEQMLLYYERRRRIKRRR